MGNVFTEKRQYARHLCDGRVEVHLDGAIRGQPPALAQDLSCILADISLCGCYAQTPSPLPLGTWVKLRVIVKETEVRAVGLVMTSHPGSGMGIAFTELLTDDYPRLKTLIYSLKAEQPASAT